MSQRACEATIGERRASVGSALALDGKALLASPPSMCASLAFSDQTIFVVDDDASVRQSLDLLFRCEGYRVETYRDAGSFLESIGHDRSGCVVLDLRMPGASGLFVQAELTKREVPLPVVFISGNGSIPITVEAMRAGAIDFLTKPYEEEELLAAVARALARGDADRRNRAYRDALRARLALLTAREGEVARRVAKGMLNKQIAVELGVAEKTIAVHRARVMEKLDVRSVPDLVRLIDRVEGEAPPWDGALST